MERNDHGIPGERPEKWPRPELACADTSASETVTTVML
jgi:hypothetical protein